MNSGFIDETAIAQTLKDNQSADAVRIGAILQRARMLQGIPAADVAALMTVTDLDLLQDLFNSAQYVKDTIYGKRLVLFAPLYISNLCANECLYCAFRANNTALKRRALSQEEIADEVRQLIGQGHKRVLMVAGEAYPKEGFSYVLKSIETIYSVVAKSDSIRRVNVNVAPLSVQQFGELKNANIGTYQIFQETYHRQTYANVHLAGKKRDYDWRVTAVHRAMEAGINDVGIGVLFGLADWRFEVLALMQHIASLEQSFGVGPHTISVPRLEPAIGSDIAGNPPFAVSDFDFKKIVAILRLAVPYTGIIMSTRETAEIRRESFALGVSQISAGSRTDPGGYGADHEDTDSGQFSLGDHRALDEVIRDVAAMGYIPSFCTGCYRMGRTGADFMDLAKPGEIKTHCEPNGVSTFLEYLLDYGSAETKKIGEILIDKTLDEMVPFAQKRTRAMVEKIRAGERDVYC